MSDNNQKPNAWGQNKNIPDSWGKNKKLPENWSKQSSNSDNGTPSVRTKATSSASAENTANLSDKARSGVGLLAGAAKKVGGAAKNAAGNAVEYAKSDDVKDKLNAAKNKAKSIADSAGSSLADIKEKTSDAINERRVSKSELSGDNTSDEIVEDTSDTAIAEDTLIADSFDDTSIEDDEMSAEPSAEADTGNYVPDEADDEVYDTEQEEKYAYAENDVVEETSDYDESELAEEYEEDVFDNDAFESEGSLKKNIIIGAIVLAVGIGAITGIGYFYKKSIENKKHSASSEIESNISDTQDIEANSDNLRKATLSALTEMSEEGYDLGGTYIISSLQDYNTDLPSGNFDIDKFYKKVNIFFNKSDSYQWFVLVKDEGVSVASIGTAWDDKVIDSWNSDNGSSIPNETLQDLYEKTKNTIPKSATESNQRSTTTVVTTSESDKAYTLEKYSVEIKIGEITNVNILHYPEGCDETNEYWTSSDYNIASVNVHGYITGVSSGECTVSISCKDNPNIKTDISVVVIDEKSTESTEPNQNQPNAQLGVMYNKFYISSLTGGSSGGYIEDYNGDGVDDLICWRANAGYVVTYYKNGELVYDTIPNTFGYTYNEPLFGMKTEYYDGNTLREKCREKGIDCGFTINKDFYMGSTNAIGYVNTSDINSTLNVRSAPSTDSDVLVQIPNGKLFNVIPESTGQYGVYNNKGWYYISVNQDGVNYMGYISADYAIAWDNAI